MWAVEGLQRMEQVGAAPGVYAVQEGRPSQAMEGPGAGGVAPAECEQSGGEGAGRW